MAPDARLAVFFAPDTDAGFVDVLTTALYDGLRKPRVISVSWGSSEDDATDQFLRAMDQVLQDAAAMGVTVCCETGDFGSSDEQASSRDGRPHVEFPATSSPFALACGGTRLTVSRDGVRSEVVWNDGDAGGAGGGGMSNKFARPAYQGAAKVPSSTEGIRSRGVPDVAANAAGYQMVVRGREVPIVGTSAVAPLWAGLIAMINQRLTSRGGKPVGFLNPMIYDWEGINAAFNDVIEGNNGIDGTLKRYVARAGWDPCTGLGSPTNGVNLLQALDT